MNPLSIHPKIHTVIKENETYTVFLTGSGIKLFDFDGNEKTIYTEISGEVDETIVSLVQQDRPTVIKKASFAATTKNANKWRTITIDDVDYYYFYYYQTGEIGTIYKSHSGTAADTGQDPIGHSNTIYKNRSKSDYSIEINYINHKINTRDDDENTTLYTEYPITVGSILYNNPELTDENGKVTALSISNNTISRTGIIKTPLSSDNPIINYITTSNPLEELDASTIGDYTFIVNKTKTVSLDSETSENLFPSAALIFVRQGDYTTDYKITINGNIVADYTTTADVTTTKTNKIAEELYNDLTTNLDTDVWNIRRLGSVLCVEKIDGSSFTIQSEDSNADYNLFAYYKESNSLQTLPLVAPNGFILKIIGEQVATEDDYYVKFKTTDNSDFGSGTWIECAAPDIPYKFDASTMPHGIVRNADGTFTFKQLEWTPRGAGDEDTAPNPSFIGNTIQEVFTHKGRLAFIAADKSCYSDTQDIFSFFKKTTQAELDTDPIDVTSNSKMVDLKHSLAFNEELLLFSPTTEFTLKGGDIFSNSTVAIDLAMNYQCSSKCKPVNAGSTAFFLFENGEYSKMMEIYITSTYSLDARETTEQAPSYLPKNIYKIANSTSNNIACLLSTEHRDTIYCYNYYYNSEQKAQSAWSKWKFDNAQILNVDFKDNLLYLVVQYSDGVYFLKMNFSPKNKEEDLDYLFFLDRKVYLDSNDLTYNPSTNKTTFTKPYALDNELTILNNIGFPINYTITNNIISVEGQYNKLIVGNTYNSKWGLSKIFVRQQSSNGGLKVREGILMLRDINLTYANSGYFKVIVTPKYSTAITSTFEFTGKITGLVSATLEQIPVSDGTFLIPITSKNDEIDVEIINDSYLPSDFLSLEWLGDFVVRGQ